MDAELTEPLEQPLVCPDVQIKELRKLATEMILHAMREATNKRLPMERRLDALLWLTGPDAPWWCEWAGLPFADTLKLATSGDLKNARLQVREAKK